MWLFRLDSQSLGSHKKIVEMAILAQIKTKHNSNVPCPGVFLSGLVHLAPNGDNMDNMDDVVGAPLWRLPRSPSELRDEFIRETIEELEMIKRLDIVDVADFVKSTKSADLYPQIDFSSLSEEDSHQAKEKAIKIIESIMAAAQSGTEGQTILIALYNDGVLYGHCVDPENSTYYTTQARILTEHTPEQFDNAFLYIIVEAVLKKWANEKNAVIAWGAIRELCDINFPDDIPSV